MLRHVLFFVLVSLTARSVAAESATVPSAPALPDESPEPAGYRAFVEEGLREYDAGSYGEARALFQRAHALFANARTFRALAMVEFEVRNYVACADLLVAALGSQARPLDEQLRTDAERLLARARTFVGYLVVKPSPHDAVVSVDGRSVSTAAPLALNLGVHGVDVRAPGYTPASLEINIEGSKTETVDAVLHASAPIAPIARSERAWRKSPWLWTALGVVVAGAATGIALAVARDEHHASYDRGTSGALVGAP